MHLRVLLGLSGPHAGLLTRFWGRLSKKSFVYVRVNRTTDRYLLIEVFCCFLHFGSAYPTSHRCSCDTMQSTYRPRKVLAIESTKESHFSNNRTFTVAIIASPNLGDNSSGLLQFDVHSMRVVSSQLLP
jgi:hypothetical protein